MDCYAFYVTVLLMGSRFSVTDYEGLFVIDYHYSYIELMGVSSPKELSR